MRADAWQRLALVVAGLLLAAGIGTLLFGSTNSGVRLGLDGDGHIDVAAVASNGLAAIEGVRAGQTVVRANGVELVRLPEPIVEEDAAGNEVVTGWDPPTGEFLEVGDDTIGRLLDGPVEDLIAIDSSAMAARPPQDFSFGYAALSNAGRWLIGEPAPAVVIGVLVLLGGTLLVAAGRAGATLRPLAIPLATATAAPFLLSPLLAVLSGEAILVHGILLTAAMLILAAALLSLLPDDRIRWLATLTTGALVALALIATVARATGTATLWPPVLIQLVALGTLPLIPGLLAAGLVDGATMARPTEPGGAGSGRVLQATEYAIGGATPLFAMLSEGFGPLPILLWLGVVVLGGRLTIRPLARVATRAALQRDLVVAATEAERARVAADIHDDALQELTLLVRRLDSAGDAEGAEIARHVADRLRAICGDLRLPILDDLGVGPALDWLVVRIERLAGGEVRLERSDATRPPPDVELAFFRVAQEALANAVKHGQAPIVVRYQTTRDGASLSIDDAGPGIPSGAGVAAEQAGHFGLLNMAQRADQIGAILDVRAWPGGGTHVALDWRTG